MSMPISDFGFDIVDHVDHLLGEVVQLFTVEHIVLFTSNADVIGGYPTCRFSDAG